MLRITHVAFSGRGGDREREREREREAAQAYHNPGIRTKSQAKKNPAGGGLGGSCSLGPDLALLWAQSGCQAAPRGPLLNS